MSALCELLDEHSVAVEGDLWELYRVDVLDVFRGTLTARRALVFVERALMDPRSHLRAEVLGDDRFLGWSHAEGILANLSDTLEQLLVVVGKAIGMRLPPLSPYPRPTVRDVAPVQPARTLAEFDLSFLTT